MLVAGSGLGHDEKQSRPADMLVNNWGFNGKPAAIQTFRLRYNLTLFPKRDTQQALQHLPQNSERYKKIRRLGWSCISLVVESFGAWGQLASNTFKELASRPSVQINSTTFTTLDSIYCRLNLSLACALECHVEHFLHGQDPVVKHQSSF